MMKELIDKLYKEQTLSREEFLTLLQNRNQETSEYLYSLARSISQQSFGTDIYLRASCII